MRSLLTSLAVLAALMPVGSLAQDVSEDELLKLFTAQKDAYKAALEGNTARTRGLTLVKADDLEIAKEVAVETPPDSAPPETEVATVASEEASGTATETVVSVSETATLVKMPVDLGVNIRIAFAFDSAALDEGQKPKLQTLCNVMRTADIQLFRIIGHTDASGSDDYNERLSRLRAEEVQRYFVNDCGIVPGRLEAIGLGKRFLLEGVSPDAEQNRRVEFQALS